MEECVDKLQHAFRLAELNIDYLEKKVNTEFVDATADSDAHGSTQQNPSHLIESLEEVKRDYADLLKDVDEIKKMQWEAVHVFREELLSAVQSLQALQSRTGVAPPPQLACDEEIKDVAEIMDIPMGAAGTSSCSTSNGQLEETFTVESQELRMKKTNIEQINKSPYTKRKSESDFMEITADEFTSVSSSVRGRVKLGDVNRTYRLLWEHFKEQQNSEPLTPAEMDAMSLRVTGSTGEAKLNVLRSLKLLSISKKREVYLL